MKYFLINILNNTSHFSLSKYKRIGIYWICSDQKYNVFWVHVLAPHSSTIAWKIPWTEGPGRLQSMGSQRVGQDGATSLSLLGSLVLTVCLCFSSKMEEGCAHCCPEMQSVIDKKMKFLLHALMWLSFSEGAFRSPAKVFF